MLTMPAVRSIAGPMAHPATPAPASTGAPRIVMACARGGFRLPPALASPPTDWLTFAPFFDRRLRQISQASRQSLDKRRRLTDGSGMTLTLRIARICIITR